MFPSFSGHFPLLVWAPTPPGEERRRLIGEYVLAKPDKIDKEDLRLYFHDHCDDPYVDADLPDAP
jgi:hypothetical protein